MSDPHLAHGRYGKRVAQAALLVGIVVVLCGGALWTCPFVRLALLRYRVPRPMFHKWGEGSIAEGWLPQFVLGDDATCAYCDPALNLLVIIVCRGVQSQPSRTDEFAEDYAVLLKDSPWEIRVTPRSDEVMLVDEDGVPTYLSIGPGEAERFYDTLWDAAYGGIEGPARFLDILKAEYDGPDCERLLMFINGGREQHPRTRAAPTSAPGPTTQARSRSSERH